MAGAGHGLVKIFGLGAVQGQFERQAQLDEAAAVGFRQERVFAEAGREFPLGQPHHGHRGQRQAANLGHIGHQNGVRCVRSGIKAGLDQAGQLLDKVQVSDGLGRGEGLFSPAQRAQQPLQLLERGQIFGSATAGPHPLNDPQGDGRAGSGGAKRLVDSASGPMRSSSQAAKAK